MEAATVKQNPTIRRIASKLLPLALGAAGGYGYWYFIGCSSGSCPITSTWHTSTLYGLLVGASWLLPGPKRSKKTAAADVTPTLPDDTH